MKKTVLFRITHFMLTCLVSVNAIASDISAVNSDGKTIYYNWKGLNNKTELYVTYLGNTPQYSNEYVGNIVIPSSVTYNGTSYPVVGIGSNAFAGNTNLTSVTIPSSITYIGQNAFSGTSLYNNQPDGLVYIGPFAYQYKGEMPSNTSITIRQGTTGIADKAFYNCSNLVSVSIPNSVKYIGSYAFSGTGLTEVFIPNSVTSIGSYAFSGTGLTSVTIPNSVTDLSSTFYNCTSLTGVSIPNSVTSIGSYTFYGCSSLTSVIIPSSVTNIGSKAFQNCTGLTEVTVEGVTPVSITNSETFSNRANATLYVPLGSKADYVAANYWNEFKEIVEYGEKDLSSSDISIDPISAVTYNGSEQTPAITLKDRNTTLISGTNYTVSYSNNINAGTATVSITGLGNYTGTKTTTFTINKKNASGLDIFVSSEIIGDDLIYNGSAQTPDVSVKDGSTTLTSGTDYTISYSNNINAGTATVTITGKGNYTGTKSDSFTISPKSVSGLSFSAINPVTYNGSAHTPAITVTDGTTVLVENTDYTVHYNTNINAGQGFVYIKGKGNYTGTSTGKPFTINPKTVDHPTISLSQLNYTYDGNAKQPTVTVKDGSTTIPTDEYTVRYSNNTDVGTAYVFITDKEGGNYTVSSGSTQFYISAATLSGVTATSYNGTYDGAAHTISVNVPSGATIKYGTTSGTYNLDAAPTYTNVCNNTVYYEVTKSNYAAVTGSATVTITAKAVINTTITLSLTSYTYNGSAQTPAVTVKDVSTTLTSGTDYTVSYSNNINAGTATVTVTGKGNYTGTKTANFTINAKNASNLTISSISAVTYNGSAQTPAVTVKDGSTTLTSGTHYTVSYSNNTNAGTATVTVTGKGNYTGTKTANFTINAKSVSGLTISDIAAQTYTGSALTPAVTVKDGSSTLTSGTHYTVSYSNNINVGTGTVTVTGKGNYTGTKTADFAINANSASSLTISPIAAVTYSGSAQTPAVTVKDGNTTLTSGTHYTVSYSNNTNAGTATVTVTGKGNYTGTKTANFTINKAPLTVTAKSYTINQGDALPTFEAEYSGFKNSETASVLTTQPTFMCSAASTNSPATYDIDVSGAEAQNYSMTYVSGTLTIVEVIPTSVSITLGKAQTTYCYNQPLNFAGVSGISAYVASGFNPTTGTLLLMHVDEVPANTGLLLRGTAGETYEIPKEDTDFYYLNMLKGVLTRVTLPTTSDGYQNYFLKDGVFCLSDGTATVGANKAYLQLPVSTASAPSVINTPISITLNKAQTTYCSDQPLNFAGVSGIRAYVASGFNPTTGTLLLMHVDEVPANTGILLRGTAGVTYEIPVAGTDFYYLNMLKGVLTGVTLPTTSDGYHNYFLKDGVFCLSDGTATVGANKAYLQLPVSTANARRYIYYETNDGYTGVMDVMEDQSVSEDVYYNLNGQRTENPRKGLYIQRGKKVVIK